jgi:hypothetical protein
MQKFPEACEGIWGQGLIADVRMANLETLSNPSMCIHSHNLFARVGDSSGRWFQSIDGCLRGPLPLGIASFLAGMDGSIAGKAEEADPENTPMFA